MTPGVADHVGVREVDDPEADVAVLGPCARERLGGLAGAHLGLLVVGGDVARAGHELAPLAGLGLLLAAAEEVRDVRVLLGLGHVQLPAAGPGDHVRHGRSRGAAGGKATG